MRRLSLLLAFHFSVFHFDQKAQIRGPLAQAQLVSYITPSTNVYASQGDDEYGVDEIDDAIDGDLLDGYFAVPRPTTSDYIYFQLSSSAVPV